jgi:hypothetical protein
MKTLFILTLTIAALLAFGGCAKLPLDNSAPAAPVMEAGAVDGGSVVILVTVDDPDGDKVALHFQASSNSGGVVDIQPEWTSFIESGKQVAYLLSLDSGQWTLTASAKDELEEESPDASIQVTLP